MKIILLSLIKAYQTFFSPFRVFFPAAGCRFWPSCSEYAYQAIAERGIIRGACMAAIRVFKCNPWS